MAELRPQKRSRRIAMSAEELDAFLAAERTCRVATVGAAGPHVSPLWFVWHEGALWLHSITRSQRWSDLEGDPRCAVVIDAGEEYMELRGVEVRGTASVVGEVPRTGEKVPELTGVERAFARKYGIGEEFAGYDGRHAWLRLDPTKIVSWDFRKLP
jgi:nitroimidazol reductase NimA-like FMN-containing flavoprotein (pyridoxamine 5'-phosphate oxidase superfamily)